MKLDKSLLRTVLFALGVVSFVIGVYQTVVMNDLVRNYWLFMVSLACWMPLHYWRLREARAAKEAEVRREVEKLQRQAQAKKNKPGPRRR